MTLPAGGADIAVGDPVTAAFLDGLNDASMFAAEGFVDITPVAATFTTATVTFPVGRFGSAPSVTLGLVAAGAGSISLCALSGNPTATGCVIGVTRSNTTVTRVYWQAMLTQ